MVVAWVVNVAADCSSQPEKLQVAARGQHGRGLTRICVKFCLTEKIFEEKTDRPRSYWRCAVKKLLIAKMPDTEF